MDRTEIANEWLRGRHTILWGRSHDILDPSSRNAVAEELAAMWKELDDLRGRYDRD